MVNGRWVGAAEARKLRGLDESTPELMEDVLPKTETEVVTAIHKEPGEGPLALPPMPVLKKMTYPEVLKISNALGYKAKGRKKAQLLAFLETKMES